MTNRGLDLYFFWLPLALATTPLMADSVIDVGSHSLLPDTADQRIEIYVAGDDQVRGVNVRGQIGDGAGPQPEPIFAGADFVDGIWDVNATTVLGGVVGDGQYLQAGIAFDEFGITVPGDGLMVRLAISTLGIHEGSFPLLLTGTDIGESSDLIAVGGSAFAPEIANGTITIIPEPGSMLLLLLGLALVFERCRRRGR